MLWWGAASSGAPRRTAWATHLPWAFASAIWLFLVLGFIRPVLMGSWGEAVPFGIFSHLDWTAAFSHSVREPLLQPVPHAVDSRSSTARRCSSRCTARRSSPTAKLRRRNGRSSRSPIAAPGAERCGAVLALDDGLQRDDGVDPPLGLVVRRAVTTLTGGIGILLTGTVVDNWYLCGPVKSRPRARCIPAVYPAADPATIPERAGALQMAPPDTFPGIPAGAYAMSLMRAGGACAALLLLTSCELPAGPEVRAARLPWRGHPAGVFNPRSGWPCTAAAHAEAAQGARRRPRPTAPKAGRGLPERARPSTTCVERRVRAPRWSAITRVGGAEDRAGGRVCLLPQHSPDMASDDSKYTEGRRALA